MLDLGGYERLDRDKARKQGVEGTFEVPDVKGLDGKTATVTVKVLFAGAGNTGYRDAASKVDSEHKPGTLEHHQALSAAVYDHCVIEWSTTMFERGKKSPLKPTRDNFLSFTETAWLMRHEDGHAGPMVAYLGIINLLHDRRNFVEAEKAETEKN